MVDAEFDFALTAPLEEALLRGTPLYFVLETEVTRTRAYWFDERVNSPQSVRRLTFCRIDQFVSRRYRPLSCRYQQLRDP